MVKLQGFEWPSPGVPVALVPCEGASLEGGALGTANLEGKSSSKGDTSFRNQTEANVVIG